MLGSRNRTGVSEQKTASCRRAWGVLCGATTRPLDCTSAHVYGSQTRFVHDTGVVVLGSDVYPGVSQIANSRLSHMAALAHELAHAERAEVPYYRPFTPPGSYIDEAETSLRASFHTVLSARDRADLVEDARDRLVDWIAYRGDK